MRSLRLTITAFLLLVAMPLGLHAGVWWSMDHAESWRTADWSSTGTLPAASDHDPALIRIYSARTGRWKGVFATHSWIVLKEEGARSYERWEKVGWGTPVRRNNYAPDGRWYSNEPKLVFELTGAKAQGLIPKMRAAIRRYEYNRRGDYRVWPGPNSNTFVAAVLAAVPELGAALPPTAVGKDFPYDGSWAGPAPSRTGFRLSLGGYVGVTLAWIEGLEINFFGAVIGFDIRRPALKLPGFGRLDFG